MCFGILAILLGSVGERSQVFCVVAVISGTFGELLLVLLARLLFMPLSGELDAFPETVENEARQFM